MAKYSNAASPEMKSAGLSMEVISSVSILKDIALVKYDFECSPLSLQTFLIIPRNNRLDIALQENARQVGTKGLHHTNLVLTSLRVPEAGFEPTTSAH